MKPFDYVNSITHTKKNLMRDSENDVLSEKGYEPWLTNNALSYYPDTVLHANLINMYSDLDNRPAYEFFLNSIRPKKRFSKWVKSTSNEDLDMICAHYQCNQTVGRQYLSLLSSDQLERIREQQKEGGIQR